MKKIEIGNLKPQENEDNVFRVESEGSYVVPIPYREPLKVELESFVSCIENRKQPLANSEVGMRAVVMSEAALECIKTGREKRF